MDYIDWMILKFVVVVVAAFLYGLFGGVTEQEEEGQSGASDRPER